MFILRSKSEEVQASLAGVMSYLLGAFSPEPSKQLVVFISYCFKTFPVFYLVFHNHCLNFKGFVYSYRGDQGNFRYSAKMPACV